MSFREAKEGTNLVNTMKVWEQKIVKERQMKRSNSTFKGTPANSYLLAEKPINLNPALLSKKINENRARSSERARFILKRSFYSLKDVHDLNTIPKEDALLNPKSSNQAQGELLDRFRQPKKEQFEQHGKGQCNEVVFANCQYTAKHVSPYSKYIFNVEDHPSFKTK